MLDGKEVFASGGKKSPSKSINKAPEGFVPDPITEKLIDHAHKQKIDLVWDRKAHCEFSEEGNGGISGACCFHCNMGPCTLGEAMGYEYGACGATVDTIVARGLVGRVTGGASAHVEHARATAKTLKDVATGKLKSYQIRDTAKLDALYKGLGCKGKNKALAVAGYLKVKISDLPVAASAPEFITEKAVSIGTWAVNLGTMTHIGGQPYVSGSKNMVKLLTEDVEGLVGGKFYVETDPNKAAKTILSHINAKRKKLGLAV